MAKAKRKIIKIDEEKCDGCGLCIPSCSEGAIQIVEGKAKLVRESFCDGLGACLGECPQGALTIEEKVSDEYDEAGAIAHVREEPAALLERHPKHWQKRARELPEHHSHAGICSCPSAQILHWERQREAESKARTGSELRQWPVQLHLVPPRAPYFQNADLVLVADCVPVAYASFHHDFLKGNAIAMGCPKLDDTDAYVSKVTEILQNSDIKSLKVVHMEVPCCHGLVRVGQEALKRSGKDIPFEMVVIGVKGEARGD